jgi:hypothetical protein
MRYQELVEAFQEVERGFSPLPVPLFYISNSFLIQPLSSQNTHYGKVETSIVLNGLLPKSLFTLSKAFKKIGPNA